MPIKIETNENEITAYIKGEIDHHNAFALRESIDLAVEKQRPNALRIDFSEVSFMDSSGIGLIMGRYKTMQLLGGKLYVDNPSEHIEKILKLAGIEKLAVINSKKEKVK